MADNDEWSIDANEAVTISLLQPSENPEDDLKTLSSFHPRFTYPIFGDEEIIFGYQGLNIALRYSADDLLPNVDITYKKKFQTVGDTKATDVKEIMSEWLPKYAFDKPTKFNELVQTKQASIPFKPPGELVQRYSSKGRNFEIWSGLLTDPSVQELVERIQILISFFIEGGTSINLDDQEWTLERWRVFFIYEVQPTKPNTNVSPYSFVGYSTTYRFWTLPKPEPRKKSCLIKPSAKLDLHIPDPSPPTPTKLPSRFRISQFLIIPAHQHASHGIHLYNTIYKFVLLDPTIEDFTVEDPNEAFDDLRDYCDYTNLVSSALLPKITLTTPTKPAHRISPSSLLSPSSHILYPLLAATKLSQRQLARLIELYLLTTIPPAHRSPIKALTQKYRAKDENDRRYYWWRLLVKQRLWRKHKDVLKQLEKPDRVEKLEETVTSVEEDYGRLVSIWQKKSGDSNDEAREDKKDEPVERVERKGKRKIIDEDEDGEDDGASVDSKRAKV
ncbi:MAG: histone acetyltransferase 1 [Cirrosporium novae-zelandiae]|nr:MAG: histone acetyltransferase 1 [Cirrosporium novae-zelandiae]